MSSSKKEKVQDVANDVSRSNEGGELRKLHLGFFSFEVRSEIPRTLRKEN